MLARLESAYLGILRVVILVIATLALAATIIGFASALPSLLEAGGVGAEKPTGGTLGEWVAEQKAAGSTTEADATTDATAEPAVLPDIQTAATNIMTYLGQETAGLDKASLTRHLQSLADALEEKVPGRGADYAASVRQLTEDLLASKGKKLTPERTAQLIDWHHTHFVSATAAEEVRKTVASAGLMMKMGLAGSAFFAFILVIFVFIFVKIERNLRALPAAIGRPATTECPEDDNDAA